ncbi:MAG TPA: hypothetical protein VN428_11990 [Bryobacteraceae bacterium]|nr:hypothetical protein [Bryobacteraceae bacterium]
MRHIVDVAAHERAAKRLFLAVTGFGADSAGCAADATSEDAPVVRNVRRFMVPATMIARTGPGGNSVSNIEIN